MLPSWLRNGRPVTHRLGSYTISLPTLPLYLLILVLLFFLVRNPLPSRSTQPLDTTTLYGLPRVSSPFLVPPSSFIPAPNPDAGRPDHFPAPLTPKKKDMRVPNAVHYVYGLKPVPEGKEADELPYYAYLAMRSALIMLKPEKIYFHYKHLPRGPWWDRIRPHLTLIETEVPSEIFGNPIEHFAHKADVVRLYAMKWSGGIYLDIDMFITKSFDELLYYPTTMAMERSTHSDKEDLDVTGLCNAVIISEPHSVFVDRWIESYHSFNKNNWAGHSVEMPWKIARAHPADLQVLNPFAMFWPMWHGDEVDKVHQLNEYDFYKTGQFAYHAWESLAMKYLDKLNPTAIRTEDTSFHRLVRPFVGPDDDHVFELLARERDGRGRAGSGGGGSRG